MKREKINIFDFDGTIYDGDSSFDFYFFCLIHNPAIIKYIPIQIWHIALYLLGIEDKEKFKSAIFGFVKYLTKFDKLIADFWIKNRRNIKKWYLERDHSNDVIVSASPDFLLRPIFLELGAYKLIATDNDIKTGEIHGKNCYGPEKVTRLKNKFRTLDVGESYSDSMSDLPILELAKKGYIVKKNIIIKLEDYKPSKIKSIFLKKNFITFLVVGCVNAAIGISLAYLFSLFVQNGILAFIIGYLLSLVFSYFLNSIFTFNNRKYSFRLFGKFCVSYIPNFLIQLVSVYVLIGMLGVDKLFSYILSVIIGLPITFALLSLFAFSRTLKNRKEVSDD